MYTVSIGDDLQEFATRAEAIAEAKDLSDGKHSQVNVSDEKGIETMSYRYGELEHYEYDTRKLRRR